MPISPDERAKVRQVLLAERESLSGPARIEADRALADTLRRVVTECLGERLSSTVIGCYWPVRGEPDLRELFCEWPERALPHVVAQGAALGFRRWPVGGTLRIDQYSIPVPDNTLEVEPGLLIVPCLGFFVDSAGTLYRLGYGGGFYDRTLAAHSCATIGVAYDSAELASYRPSSHDVPLERIVTPTRDVYRGQAK